MKLREGEKGYKCNRCTPALSQTGHLKAHLMMHSGEKSDLHHSGKTLPVRQRGFPPT